MKVSKLKIIKPKDLPLAQSNSEGVLKCAKDLHKAHVNCQAVLNGSKPNIFLKGNDNYEASHQTNITHFWKIPTATQ